MSLDIGPDMARDGMEMLAAFVQRNVDDAANTARAIERHDKGVIGRLARAYLALVDAIDESPVVDRKVLALLDMQTDVIFLAARHQDADA